MFVSGIQSSLADPNAADNNPVLTETRFVHKVMGPKDVLILPGCPYREIFYLGHVNVIAIEGPTKDDFPCFVPVVALGPELAARLTWYARNAGLVLYSEGNLDTEFGRDSSGHEHTLQLHHSPVAGLAERRAWATEIRVFLEQWFELAPGPVSPLGRRMFTLQPRKGVETPAVPKSPHRPDESLLPSDFKRNMRPHVLRRFEYLEEWRKRLPDDPYVWCDLLELRCGQSMRPDESQCVRPQGCTRRVGR